MGEFNDLSSFRLLSVQNHFCSTATFSTDLEIVFYATALQGNSYLCSTVLVGICRAICNKSEACANIG